MCRGLDFSHTFISSGPFICRLIELRTLCDEFFMFAIFSIVHDHSLIYVCKSYLMSFVQRFMICCDTCEDWFHGDCVGVTQADGKELENRGEEWMCPKCKSMLYHFQQLCSRSNPFKVFKPYIAMKLILRPLAT